MDVLPGKAFAPRVSGPPRLLAVELFLPILSDTANHLALALIAASHAPILLLDRDLNIRGASDSFCRAFEVDGVGIRGKTLGEIGAGEWNGRPLESLLAATAAGSAAIDAYELDLIRADRPPCHLIVNAQRLEFSQDDPVYVLLTITDVTAARLAGKRRDDLVREQQILLSEIEHRVANSLQIIASVLMQSARKVQSEETRFHLRDAHNRVMSIATLQRQLAYSQASEVALRPYFTDLCRSIAASMIADDKRLSLIATSDDSRTTAGISVSLGLIVTELVINALKHAFPHPGQTGHISVHYVSEGNGWTLSVCDDGVGIGRHEVATPGLGTGIVDALSKQLDAIVSITDTAPGTRVALVHAA